MEGYFVKDGKLNLITKSPQLNSITIEFEHDNILFKFKNRATSIPIKDVKFITLIDSGYIKEIDDLIDEEIKKWENQ